MDQQLLDFLQSKQSEVPSKHCSNILETSQASSSSEQDALSSCANLMPFDDNPLQKAIHTSSKPSENYQKNLQKLLKSEDSFADSDQISSPFSTKSEDYEWQSCDLNATKTFPVTQQPLLVTTNESEFQLRNSFADSEESSSSSVKSHVADGRTTDRNANRQWSKQGNSDSSSCASVDRLLGSMNGISDNDEDDVCIDDVDDRTESNGESYLDRLKRLEEEQEQLNSSLLALTSHFAHVQLRLQQIVSAEDQSKEQLLKELEQFASRGVPELCLDTLGSAFQQDVSDCCDESEIETNESKGDELDENRNPKSSSSSRIELKKLKLQRKKQKKLIDKLKQQLAELEQYAYECGDLSVVPSGLLLQRQSVVIEQLKGRLPLELDRLDKMSPEELRQQVDLAIKRLMDPSVMKEQLVDQLKTQVTDLERFIQFLQQNGGKKMLKHTMGLNGQCNCGCQSHLTKDSDTKSKKSKQKASTSKAIAVESNEISSSERKVAETISEKVMTAVQMLAMLQFSCGSKPKANDFERNALKKSSGNAAQHFGDLRANLELSVQQLLIEAGLEQSEQPIEIPIDLNRSSERLRWLVRRRFVINLKGLIEHGLLGAGDRTGLDSNSSDKSTLVSWNCFSQKSRHTMNSTGSSNRPRMSAWDLLQTYFYTKNGDKLKQTPARQLSQSFQLPLNGVKPVSSEFELLCAIDEINEKYARLGRGSNSLFKAFVCLALNQKQLSKWLKLLFKNRQFLQRFYEPWSYVLSTGFEDGLRTLDKLNDISFELPIDSGVRHLQSINDAF